jgi:spore maturation protein CgeB
MRFVMFYHSLVSDWNHGNAHFLRGIVTELLDRGHDVQVYEPENGWSYRNLVDEHGEDPIEDFRQAYSQLRSIIYNPETIDLDAALAQADIVMVHEWNPPGFIERVGRHRANGGRYQLLFHDTHHRAVSDPNSLGAEHLGRYDGVLAFGESLRRRYLQNGWAKRVWTWHEAADVRVFRPVAKAAHEGDLVWIGNWGDGERSAELREFLLEPVRALGLKAKIHGVRYPEDALCALRQHGVEYGGWLPNFKAPEVFGRYRVTVHVPRSSYRERLPGIPTIRVFEALACGIPLICAPWNDCEHLFTPGHDYLTAKNGCEMSFMLSNLLEDSRLSADLTAHGLKTILARHTCKHRVDELMEIVES